ncbi:peptidoglycan editing factor PgeF [Derxia lacustris]|uniref:peptidoglycan editing factor PgeF n=1 Tax=Derxia lacustris TaxID=764842 RepID=UPI000A172559|nr:peptidoglycan editing factor PgeF [Derxia lacustris]
MTEHSAPPLLHPDWPLPDRVRACCTTRIGGVSTGAYGGADGQGGLNLGTHVGDAPAAVAANRQTVTRLALDGAQPVWLEQVHGTEVIELDGSRPAAPPRADGVWTRRPGLACTIMTADCLPVLIADRQGRAVGAAHAGWRGLADGVLQATVAGMRAGLAPLSLDLVAWIGPHIGQPAFEVGGEVREIFLDRMADCDAAFVPGIGGRWHADLAALATRALREAGVTVVLRDKACTVRDKEHFYSYRRDGTTGRIASFIWLAT